jgi:hypothetical protein
MTDPDGSRADRDLARLVGDHTVHRELEAIDDLVHRGVDAQEDG